MTKKEMVLDICGSNEKNIDKMLKKEKNYIEKIYVAFVKDKNNRKFYEALLRK